MSKVRSANRSGILFEIAGVLILVPCGNLFAGIEAVRTYNAEPNRAVALFGINLIVTFARPPVVVTSALTMTTE